MVTQWWKGPKLASTSPGSDILSQMGTKVPEELTATMYTRSLSKVMPVAFLKTTRGDKADGTWMICKPTCNENCVLLCWKVMDS